jgi:hypothetical protein
LVLNYSIILQSRICSSGNLLSIEDIEKHHSKYILLKIYQHIMILLIKDDIKCLFEGTLEEGEKKIFTSIKIATHTC